LYGVKCPWISRAKEAKERYSIIWQSKDTHPKADMEVDGCPESYTRHSHRGMYQRLQQVVRDCVKDISQCWKGVSDQVWEYDADDFSKPRHDEDGNRTNATNLNNPDMQYYLKQECDIPKKYEWDKVRKKVKYTFGTLYEVLQFVPNAERHCRFFRTPLPKEYRVPDDIVTKVTQKLLAGESLTTASGYGDVREFGESVRNRMRALNVITDEELLMQDTEVMY
jgi:hypothetical protein